MSTDKAICDSEPFVKVSPSEIGDRRVFLCEPIPRGKVLECTLRRDKSGFNRFYPEYTLYTSDGIKYLLSAKKRSGNATSNYLMSLDKNDLGSKGANFVGKVRSNWMGTEFSVFDAGHNPDKPEPGSQPRRTLASVHYESNLFGSKGPRVMNVYVPSCCKEAVRESSLKELAKKEGDRVTHLVNKPPRWSQETKTYVLNFNNRVDKPSVKNFILVDQRHPEEVICWPRRSTRCSSAGSPTTSSAWTWPGR